MFRKLSTGPHMHRAGKACEDVFKKIASLKTDGKFYDALKELQKIEEKYPAYAKAIQRERGELKYSLLEQKGMLPPSSFKIG